MMKRTLFVLVLVLSSICDLFSQDPVAQKYGNMITPDDLKEYLSILASELLKEEKPANADKR